MQRFLNTLYITTQKTYLHKKGEAVEVVLEGKPLVTIPLITLDSIVCFGNIYVSPFLLGSASEYNITISFLSETGKFLARVQGPVAGNVLMRKEQYRISDDEIKSVKVAKYFLIGKISNQKSVLQRAKRDHPEKVDMQSLDNAINTLNRNLNLLQNADTLDGLRGLEGDSANSYFSVFNDLITAQKNDFIFVGRNRRPPMDNINAMLSYVYTLLYHDMISALECIGLDPAVGFLHRDRPGRLSLALDLMEEFRAPFADRLILSLINRREVIAEDFEKTASGAVIMTENARKKLIKAYQERKNDVISHQYIEKKMYFAILFHTQAQLLARYIRGDIDGYPVYLWR